MFKVENADFIAEKLSKELLPNQEFREVLKNAIEAIERRMAADGSTGGGRVEFDVDWHMLKGSNQWFISCADNGDGMSRSEVERYTTTLAVVGAGRSQSLQGNQGMGLKISGPTRHKRGVLIRTSKGSERTMVQIGWNEDVTEERNTTPDQGAGGTYGLMPLANGELVKSIGPKLMPKLINEQGTGTVVTFLGSTAPANTFVPNKSNNWLFKYLNTRFFRLSDERIAVAVRVPSGEEPEWPRSAEEAEVRERETKRDGKKPFRMQLVYGTGAVWDDVSSKGGDKGVVDLPGDVGMEVPAARMHWWVIPAKGVDPSTRTHGGGSFTVLYQNELHDWKIGNQASSYFARLGVLFGKSRMFFVLEPLGGRIASDFARAHVLVDGDPVLDSDAWLVWSEQFRRMMPEAIRETIAEEQSLLQAEDPDRMKRINERLKEVMQLLRPRRFRRSQRGEPHSGPEVSGAGPGVGGNQEVPTAPSSRPPRRTGGRGLGAVLADLDDDSQQPAQEVATSRTLEPIWVKEDEAATMSIVNGNGNGMHDRAAALAGQDGRTAAYLLLNTEFRGYQSMLAAVNEWANPTGDDQIAARIEALVREWTEQKMIEAIQGLRQLENGRTWITEHYDEALSPVALTAAFMADRYHTLREVKRAIGSMRGVIEGALAKPQAR